MASSRSLENFQEHGKRIKANPFTFPSADEAERFENLKGKELCKVRPSSGN